jgi:hypothetical protein
LYFNGARCSFGKYDIAKRDLCVLDTSIYACAAKVFATVRLGGFDEE